VPVVPFVPFNEVLSLDDRTSSGDRFGNWTSSPDGIIPRNPNLPEPPSEPGRPLGIFSGKPMPIWTTPPPLGGLRNNSNTAGSDWFTALGDLLWDGNKSQASAFDLGARAAPIVPSDNPDPSSGLLGRLAALAGIDLSNPHQPAPPPDDEQEQADMRALDARLSSSGNIRDAVALYNARKSKR
jgi:hypothetical protein